MRGVGARADRRRRGPRADRRTRPGGREWTEGRAQQGAETRRRGVHLGLLSHSFARVGTTSICQSKAGVKGPRCEKLQLRAERRGRAGGGGRVTMLRVSLRGGGLAGHTARARSRAGHNMLLGGIHASATAGGGGGGPGVGRAGAGGRKAGSRGAPSRASPETAARRRA